MRNLKLSLLLLVLLVKISAVKAQYSKEETEQRRCFVGSSAFMVMNVSENERPDFAQLNFGYRLSQKDVVSLEAKTWRYFEPLGIPYGDAKSDPAENFPGYIREKGLAAAYQRYWWKGLYTGVHVMNAWQNFIDEYGNEIDDGYQIFNTYRAGYHVKLMDNKFFIEPSLAVTHRPYHTEMPEAFKQKDDKWSKVFVGEPGLHFGFNF